LHSFRWLLSVTIFKATLFGIQNLMYTCNTYNNEAKLHTSSAHHSGLWISIQLQRNQHQCHKPSARVLYPHSFIFKTKILTVFYSNYISWHSLYVHICTKISTKSAT